MAVTPAYKNDIGVKTIKIGVKGFVCIGATPPDDHPHVYLTMGNLDYKVCLYCNTRYEYDSTLSPEYTQPPECFHDTTDKHI
jgi:uncharacterized Zn-finger protein|tara:strand:- start:135 stop:380 length:246 start_codon:yes stop_codon:yes gene_type:complete